MGSPEPTSEAYGELQKAYDFFNDRLWGGDLPNCLLTLQRKKATGFGYFSAKRFVRQDGETDELAMNPQHFHCRKIEEVLSTLVHEQAHVYQAHFGKPGRAKYHNKEWGTIMKTVGLHPSKTGKPGGKETGDQMTHYIVEGGPFDVACNELLRTGFELSWSEKNKLAESMANPVDGDPAIVGGEAPDDPKDRSNRHKYTCTGCGLNAWGKPNILLMCGQCKLELVRKRK